jgi:nitrogen fixation protein NifU and related proteins
MFDELYQEVILDHYKNPRGRLKVINPVAASCSLKNPLCGDHVELSVAVDGGNRVGASVNTGEDLCPLKALAGAKHTGHPAQITLEDGVKIEIACSCHGCSISQAATSMMADLCDGRSLADICSLCQLFRDFMRGKTSSENLSEILGDAVALEGVRKFSARVKCAMLPWEALEKCVQTIRTENSKLKTPNWEHLTEKC